MDRFCSRCRKTAIAVQSGARVRDGVEFDRWIVSLCADCVEIEERVLPPTLGPDELATVAHEFFAQLRSTARSLEAAGDVEQLRELGPLLDDIANNVPQPIPADLSAIAARYRPPGA